jgi:ATP-dependent RNA helicase RhlE
MSFESFGLASTILKGIQDAGYQVPTPIQQKAIPVLLQGRDIIGCAQTGTGKTAAFVLPILHRIKPERRLRALILVPTRELALQVGESIRTYGRHTGVKSVTIYGGVKIEPQTKTLRQGVDVIVATPGRLLDHVERGNIDFTALTTLVLDEADRMLDMGFIPDIRRIIRKLPRDRHTMLFSATMPLEIRSLAREMLRDPVTVEATPPSTAADGITHRVFPVPAHLKGKLLLNLLEGEKTDSALIFVRTRRGVEKLARLLQGKGHRIARLHSDRTQGQREKALNDFRQGKSQILVATNIAARGLDIDGISHVFSYDVPDHPDDYVHRSGRTARAGEKGDAVILMSPEEAEALKSIERHLNGALIWAMHPDFNYTESPPGGVTLRHRAALAAAPAEAKPARPRSPFGRRKREESRRIKT